MTIPIESKIAQVTTCIMESDGTFAELSDIVRQAIVLQDADTRYACAQAVYELALKGEWFDRQYASRLRMILNVLYSLDTFRAPSGSDIDTQTSA